MLRRYDGKDAALLLPATLPPAMTFEPNKAYVRDVLADQVGYRADGLDIEDRDGKPSPASTELPGDRQRRRQLQPRRHRPARRALRQRLPPADRR